MWDSSTDPQRPQTCKSDKRAQAYRCSQAPEPHLRPCHICVKFGSADRGPEWSGFNELVNLLLATCERRVVDSERYFEDALRYKYVNVA